MAKRGLSRTRVSFCRVPERQTAAASLCPVPRHVDTFREGLIRRSSHPPRTEKSRRHPGQSCEDETPRGLPPADPVTQGQTSPKHEKNRTLLCRDA